MRVVSHPCKDALGKRRQPVAANVEGEQGGSCREAAGKHCQHVVADIHLHQAGEVTNCSESISQTA